MKVIKYSKINLKEIIESIKKGEIIICPTDTIYGLVADAKNDKAVKKIFEIKKRQKKNPIPVFVKDVKMAKELAQIDRKKQEFLNKIWPGEITVVLKRRKNCKLPGIIFGGKETIGLRIPKNNLIKNLLKETNRPLTGTSANLSGKEGSGSIEKVLRQFEKQKFQPDLAIDAGDLKKKKASTVIDFKKNIPRILRKGGFSQKELLKMLEQ